MNNIYLLLVAILIFFNCKTTVAKDSQHQSMSRLEEIKKSLDEQRANVLSSEELKTRLAKLKSAKTEIVAALKKSKSLKGAFPFLVEKEFTYKDDFRNIEYWKITPTAYSIEEISKNINYLPIVKVLEKGSDFLITPTNPKGATIEIEERPVYSGKFPLIDFDFLEKENKWVIRTIRYDRD